MLMPSIRRGFSLIELVIVVVIIGIIAAIAVPRMSRGADTAAENALRMNLAQVRNAIELFRTEVGSLPPGATGTAFTNALTQYRLTDGTFQAAQPAAGTSYTGPYLRQLPAAPLGRAKGQNGVDVGTSATVPSTGAAWYYNSDTGQFRLNDTDYATW